MLNCAVIMGRLTADPELRQTPNGISVTRFTVAVDRGYVKAGEERKADFINVIAWRQTAEFVSKYFSKGSMIAVQGSIQTGSYEKDGVKRYTFEVSADNVSFCGSKNESSNGGANVATAAAPSFANGSADDFAAMADDDDLPF
ncbi:MAG: single-stranded DNA-binding protein [Ruminococcaceae bacterium]|nr:single-stranded DNA-binding protein [Oscillospiraceae bacterium]